MCAVIAVIFRVYNSVRMQSLFLVAYVRVRYIQLEIQTPPIITPSRDNVFTW
jgi:hypothetical protein